ncbi:hypothetical protein L596_018417 [Steinernema carpocapsae]|uniref:Uncharacterized protein n=1 Tax=Steinernema carpocapsae TaxID=34508 RepID=A0A4V6A222_STECR|nr:hypothetical protein L596_018417 [Steinernema carpocapsae]
MERLNTTRIPLSRVSKRLPSCSSIRSGISGCAPAMMVMRKRKYVLMIGRHFESLSNTAELADLSSVGLICQEHQKAADGVGKRLDRAEFIAETEKIGRFEERRLT